MTSLSYTEKYFVVCYLVLFLVINAVAEISLAEYFGTDKALSSGSDRFVESQDCDSEEMLKSCYEKCGPKHVCLQGQCICFEDRASPVEVSDEELQEVASSEEQEKNRGAEIGNENESLAEISLAEYFGTNKALSSKNDRFVELQDCDSEEMQKSCYEKCGPKHVCLQSQCICFEDRASPVKVSDEELQEATSSEEIENNRGAETGNENESRNGNVHVLKTLQCLISQHRNTAGNSNRESNRESNSVEEDFVARPALRHHIAHFCPNLDEARICIRKCMKLNLPAFCGKDHVCYCGHKDQHSIEALKDSGHNDNDEEYNPFRDLYAKYFGIPK